MSTLHSVSKSLSMLTLGALLLAAGPAAAAPPKLVPVEGVGYNVASSLKDNLAALKGKRVRVTLRSGNQLTGRVTAVGPAFLHLGELEAREHFDALVRLEDISAVDTRFRQLER